ncbi:thiamine pyrophosphate-binding protein [Candidatus Pelagibacter sp.]|jgi:acetolactate synthase I/II/III large subunit|nr:thiamine pyrophosphate-binding protein [Candidatus Pelagibacter sp.]
MLVSDYILDFLVKKKVKKVFLITGGAITFVVDAFSRNKKINYIDCGHEQSAAMMADAYSRMGPKFSATMVTSGPGATNLLTGIACSWFDSIPGIHICGQVNSNELSGAVNSTKKVRQVGFQETDIVSMAKPITKFAYRIKNEKEIPYILDKAFQISTTGRPGPVLIDIPMNFQRKVLNPKFLKKFHVQKKNMKHGISKKINLVYNLLKKSKRPVFILGGGVEISNSRNKLNKLFAKYKVPYLTTWSGKDCCYYGQKNFVGTIGVYGNRAANFAVQNSDFILNIGSRLDTRITGGNPSSFGRKAKIVSVDIDKYELNKKRGLKNYLKLNYDLSDFLESFNSKLQYKCDVSWLKKCEEWNKNYPTVLKSWRTQKKYTNPYFFIEALSEILNKKDIIIADDGAHLTWAVQAFKIKKGQRFFSAFGNSPMGYALPASIGASIAKNKKRVICIDGDGSLQINLQELHTLACNKLPIKIFILNNNGYGIIKQFQELYLSKRFEASGKGVSNPDFKKIAKAFGINYNEIKNHYNLKTKLKKIINSNQPEFINVLINPNQKIIPKLQFGKPIEDLSPLLNRNEFSKNMFVDQFIGNSKLLEIN